MPWKDPEFILFDPRIRSSFKCGNLTFDHDGRFAFLHGDRVQCTRKNVNYFANIDFRLGGSREISESTDCVFWRDVPGVDRALLVVGTARGESSDERPASVQIWNTAHGQGEKLDEFQFNERTLPGGSEVEHVCGFAQLSRTVGCPPLVVGVSTGQVLLLLAQRGATEFAHILTMTGLRSPVVALAADVSEANFVAAADEDGQVVVWSLELISEGTYGYKTTYQFDSSLDPCTAIGLRDGVLVTGHMSGILRFHSIRSKYIYADVVTNSKAIMCLDMHPKRDWVAVGGEDCRMSCLEFARDDEHESVLLLSVCINGVITGLQFTRTQDEIPSLALMVFELPYIIYYDYHSSSGGGLTSVLVKPRSRVVKAALESRRRRVGDRAKLSMVEVDEMAQKLRSSRLSSEAGGSRRLTESRHSWGGDTDDAASPLHGSGGVGIDEDTHGPVGVSDLRSRFEDHPAE